MEGVPVFKTPIFVVEGPDMSGKTTFAKKVSEKDNVSSYARYFKFPVYDSIFGDKILRHLKTFGDNDFTTIDKNIFLDKIKDFSLKQFGNKAAGVTEFINLLFKNDDCEWKDDLWDFVVIDRFVLSQYIYDIAWDSVYEGMLNRGKKEIDKKLRYIDDKDWADFQVQAYTLAKMIYDEFYTHFPNMYTMYFRKSEYIKRISELSNKKDRRIDSFDSMDLYQESVSDEFERYIDSASGAGILGKSVLIVDTDLIYKRSTPDLYNKVLDPETESLKPSEKSEVNIRLEDMVHTIYEEYMKPYIKAINK